MTFYLEWDTDPLQISIRQLAYFFPTVFTSLVVIWYSTRFKDIKKPLIASFVLFLVVCCSYAGMKPTWGNVQYGINVISGIGQAAPITLILVATQFAAPHAYLSTATGLALSSRAIGGAFGSAVLYSIINGHVSGHYDRQVGATAISSGLPVNAVAPLLAIMKQGNGPPTTPGLVAAVLQVIPSIPREIVEEAANAGHAVYAKAYQLAWASIVPFVVIAIVCCANLRDVKQLMTERVEATVEKPLEKTMI